MNKHEFKLVTPVTGKVINMSQINDPVFSQKMMGDGFAVQPSNEEIVAPIAGKIITIAKTKHAIGIKTTSGLEVLLHLGIDTVKLDDKPFTIEVSVGQEVKAGQDLAKVNLAQLKEAKIDDTIIVAITNSSEKVKELTIDVGEHQAGEEVATGIVKEQAVSEDTNNNAKQNLGEQILNAIGGKENVIGLTHCATRLRFTVKDDKLVDLDKEKSLTGVLGAVKAGGQYQIVIGQNVADIYNQIIPLIDTDAKNVAETNKNENWVSKALDIITGIFTPILPAITGAAMIKTLLIILQLFHVLSTTSPTYIILNMVGDTAFTFLPIFLAYSSSKKFGLNPYVGMVLGAMLLQPTWTQLVKAGKPINLFGFLPVTLASYGSTVIPIILIIWVASYVDKFAKKISPEKVRFFLQPSITLLVMIPIAFCAVGPLGYLIGKGLGSVISQVQTHAIWALPIIFGTLAPLFVMTGMHYAVTIPLVLTSVASQGFDMLGIGYLVSNIAQGAAGLAVGMYAKKNDNLRALAYSSGITALLGVTEPVLYGVNLKYKKPFVAVMIGGFFGGLIGGIFQVKRMTFAPTGLTTLPIFIDPKNPMNFVGAIIGIVVSFVITFVLTIIMIKKDPKLQNEIGAN